MEPAGVARPTGRAGAPCACPCPIPMRLFGCRRCVSRLRPSASRVEGTRPPARSGVIRRFPGAWGRVCVAGWRWPRRMRQLDGCGGKATRLGPSAGGTGSYGRASWCRSTCRCPLRERGSRRYARRLVASFRTSGGQKTGCWISTGMGRGPPLPMGAGERGIGAVTPECRRQRPGSPQKRHRAQLERDVGRPTRARVPHLTRRERPWGTSARDWSLPPSHRRGAELRRRLVAC